MILVACFMDSVLCQVAFSKNINALAGIAQLDW